MLPSPTWPNGTARAPGIVRSTASVAWAMKLGDAGHRHRDVVLDRAALVFLRLDDGLAHASRAACAWPRCDAMVASWTSPASSASPRALLDRLAQGVASRAGGQFHQHVPRDDGSDSGSTRAGDVLEREVERYARHQLEGRSALSPARAWRRLPAARSRRRGRGPPAKRGLDLLGRGEQLQHGGGDDAQRAFGADEQVLQVVAGVVLAQPPQAVPDLGRRAAPLRGPAPGRAYCRSAAPRCRRHWSRGCRRSGRCLPTPGSAGTGGRRRRPPAAASASTQPASTVMV